jgi:hypothetical protein
LRNGRGITKTRTNAKYEQEIAENPDKKKQRAAGGEERKTKERERAPEAKTNGIIN